jgi:hypothetical protein
VVLVHPVQIEPVLVHAEGDRRAHSGVLKSIQILLVGDGSILIDRNRTKRDATTDSSKKRTKCCVTPTEIW